ncbi:hypothetical protein ABH994_001659 [Bradyrhizobium yuanmingense]|uniref:carbohydrate-binding protein n=1 Tax=Bradyrhizobium yuanmingense TaxID=108015 RepID=UPI003514BC09
MTALVSYSTGLASVAAGGTVVTGSGTIWSGVNARPGDVLQIGNFQSIVSDVVDVDELTIPPWGGGAQTAVAYKIWQVSPQRFAGAQAMADVSTLVAALNKEGFYWFVDVDGTEPDPSLGDDGQYASQPTTGKTWVKSGGAWSYLGIFRAFRLTGAWSGATAYAVGDVVTLTGSSYVCVLDHTNQAPPNTTYWQLLASKGADGVDGAAATVSVGTTTTGAGGSSANVTNSGTSSAAILDFTIPAGKSYGGTSTTSLTIGAGSKPFTTQSGLAYQNGARVRASSAANTSNWMEGLATYSGTTLTINVDKLGGSGTFADWNLNVVGEPGAGDLSSANNLSELSSSAGAAESRRNLGIPGRNYLINPSGEIDQEVVAAGVSRADAAYDFDQWLTLTQSNPVTVSAVADAENGTPVMMRSLQANVSAQRFGRIQWLESRFCKELRGKAVVLSARVRMSAAATLRYAIVEWTGTADAISKDIVADWTNGTFTAGNFFSSTSTTIVAAGSVALSAATLTDIAALTGNVSGSMNNLAVLFWTDSAQAQNVTLDIGKVKLEQGSAASPFVAPHFDAELDACQRYFEKSYDYSVAVGAAANYNGVRGSLQNSTPASYGASHFVKRKRVAPTVTLYSPLTGASGNGYDTVDRAASASRVGETGYLIVNVFGSATTPMLYHFTANARL